MKAYEKPELNDALAQLVGPDFNTLDELKENIRTSLADAEKSRLEGEYIDKALDAVLDISTLDYPPVVVEDQIDGMMQDLEGRLRQFGIQDINWYFQQVGQTPEQYRESIRETATKVARRNLVLSESGKRKARRLRRRNRRAHRGDDDHRKRRDEGPGRDDGQFAAQWRCPPDPGQPTAARTGACTLDGNCTWRRSARTR